MLVPLAEREAPLNIYADLTPSEYGGCVQAANINTRAEMVANLSEYFTESRIDPANVCFIVTGSDGKSERHAKSITEVGILTNDPTLSFIAEDFTMWYSGDHMVKKDITRTFDVNPHTGIPDVRHVSTVTGNPSTRSDTDVLSYAFGDRKRVYPDRIINAQHIFGNEEILRDAKRQVYVEATTPPTGKRIRQDMKVQLRDYKRSLADGGAQGVYHRQRAFSLEPAMQYYSEDKSYYTLGFKIPALRTIQRSLDLYTVESIMSGKLTIDDAVTFPTDTVGRIDALQRRGHIPIYSVNSNGHIGEAYDWFLQQYHAAQNANHRSGKAVAMPFSQEEFVTHQRTILSFLHELRG